jgi:hypothetical protein
VTEFQSPRLNEAVAWRVANGESVLFQKAVQSRERRFGWPSPSSVDFSEISTDPQEGPADLDKFSILIPLKTLQFFCEER